jgi:hypothetical protein
MDQVSNAPILRNWAKFRRQRRTSWLPVEAILKAARNQSFKAQGYLEDLLNRSDALFDPLCDPLHTDLGLHRWLRKDREEAYSDWLAWIIQQISEPEDVLKLLCIDDPPLLNRCYRSPVKVKRELVIENGRLDIVISIDDPQMILLIEVKLTSADEAETDKNKGYSEWLTKQSPEGCKRAMLLIVDAEEGELHGFVPIRWAELCIRLRRMVCCSDLRNRLSVVKRAMFVAFIGAVETNLLHLSAPRRDDYVTGLFYARTAIHIEEAVNQSHE